MRHRFNDFFREASNKVLPIQECSEKKEPTILMNLDPGELTKAKILEYLRGESQTDECKDLFKEYQVCLNKALKSKGIDTMIEEARKASPNNDNAKQSKH